MSRESFDAVVVGAGPNGLAAAIVLAASGLSTLVLERAAEVGGGARSAELTAPGFLHDVCSTVHPLAFASPFFALLPLEHHGCTPVHSPAALAHVLAHDDVVTVERSVADTAAALGRDGTAYRRLFEPLVSDFAGRMTDTLGPLRWPRRPLAFARFGTAALRSIAGLVRLPLRRHATATARHRRRAASRRLS